MKITLEQRQEMARHVQLWSIGFLAENTDVARSLAVQAATDAANEYGRILALVLEEHGVEVSRTSGERPENHESQTSGGVAKSK
jgi:hypothetical protein